ncbi:MAG: BspA family leucine-rich repeat surface protein, partial [Halieaceae bacterium]|nr:BspA family leucine-rich repeat surface protein [Halieaceae bacterium]
MAATDSCEAPGPLPPEAPAISDIEPLDQAALLYLTEPPEIGAEITGYQYQTRRHENSDHQQSDTWHDAGDASSPIVIRYFEESTPLVNGETYSVQVRAVNSAGPGEASSRSETFSPYAAAPPVPDAPEIIGVTTGHGTATISFSVPADNGAPITNFAIRYTTQFGQTEAELTPASPPVTEGPVTIPGLTNGERYTVSIAAINANGTSNDSNEVSFTPGTACSDVADWTAPADSYDYFCSIGLAEYSYADFHILTTDGTGVCAARDTYLPTGENNNQGLFCAQTDNTVRAIYNWNNKTRAKELTWLTSVEQIGSRSQGSACGDADETVAGRCANQLVDGNRAFISMAGVGGAGIVNLDTSNLSSFYAMFAAAKNFNENIGAWDTTGVEEMGEMFTEASSFDQDIGDWDTSNVEKMRVMFAFASSFNRNIGDWDTSTVRDMTLMFDQAAAFNQDLHQWDVSNIDSKPNYFDGGTDNWTGIDPVSGSKWCNDGRPQWGTDGTSGCSTAQAPDEIIEAIMGGGTVIGTECVNGKVVELVSSDAIIDFGPDLTLFVKPSGKTRLRKDAGYKWVNGAGDSSKDKVNFIRVDTGKAEGVAHYLSSETAANEVAEFGTSAGGPAAVIQGQGTHQMQFVSQTRQEVTLGTMYTAEASGGYPTEYSCVTPGLLPPDKPTNVVAEAHASGGMLVEFIQDGPGGDPTSYTFEAELKGAAGGGVRRGDVVDTEGKPDTSSPFLITPTPPFSDNPGEWRIRITAVNAAGEATSDWSNYITPSVEAPPVPDAPVITGVTTSNGKATISFIAPEDYGEAITNYAYRLTGKFDDPELFATLNPPIVKSPITVAGLVDGKTYTVSIAAINANGMGPDSNEEEFTVGTECDAVTDWTTAATEEGWSCTVDGKTYEYADFHILTINGTDVCANPVDQLPTEDNDGKGLFCSSDDGTNTVRAIYDWDNAYDGEKPPIALSWLIS